MADGAGSPGRSGARVGAHDGELSGPAERPMVPSRVGTSEVDAPADGVRPAGRLPILMLGAAGTAPSPDRAARRPCPEDRPLASPPLSFSTRPKRRRWTRALVAVVVLVALIAALAAATAGLLWTYAWFRLAPTAVAGLVMDDEGVVALGEDGPTAPEGTTTALVALLEDRDPTLPGEPPLAGPVALVQTGGARGDDVAVVLLPAALPVTVDGEGTMPLRDVHEQGGPDLLVRAVVDHTGVAIDHLIAADAGALPDLVDALGDVEVCDPSCTALSPEDARERVAAYAAAASPAELERSFADLVVAVEATAARVDGRSRLLSPLATRRAIDIVGNAVTTDVALRGAALLPVAERLAATGQIAVATLPGVTNPDSGQLLVLPEQAEVRFALLRDGGVPDSDAGQDDAAILADVRVAVLNGTGTTGYAAALESLLVGAGVQVIGTGNATTVDREVTVLQYGVDDPLGEVGAVLLAGLLDADVELEPVDRPPALDGEPVTVLVIGGADLDEEAQP